MKIFGHAAGGYLATRLLTKAMKVSDTQKNRLLIWGTIAGTMPDWDYFWYAIQKGGFAYSTDFRHHTWITHTFPFYWFLSAVLYGLGIWKKKDELKQGAAVMAVSTSTHLVQDMIGSGDGIMLYYPFSKSMTGIGLLNVHGDEWNRVYSSSPIYLIELGIIFLAAISFFLDLIKRHKRGPA